MGSLSLSAADQRALAMITVLTLVFATLAALIANRAAKNITGEDVLARAARGEEASSMSVYVVWTVSEIVGITVGLALVRTFSQLHLLPGGAR